MQESALARPVSASRISGAIAVFAASMMFFLISMDTLIINVALPTIAADFGGSMAAQQWTIDGYTLAFAALLLLSGNLADRFGARRVFAISCAAFAASSLACAAATSMESLVAGRIALGASAAGILPASMTIIREAYPDAARRARALGVWMAGGAIAAAAGPFLGGVLTPLHWSLIFLVNIPFCLCVLILVPRIALSEKSTRAFDFPGQALATIGLGCLVGGIIEGGERGFASPLVAALLVLGVACMTAFAITERRVASPLMPPMMFISTEMRVALFAGFAFIFSWFGMVFIVNNLLQQDLGLSPLAAGFAFVPSAITALVGNMASPRIAHYLGVRTVLIGGFAVEAIGLIGMALLAPTLSLGEAAVGVAVSGLGGSACMPAASSLVLDAAPPAQAGIASGVFNTVRQVGASISVALFGMFVTIAQNGATALTWSLFVAAVLIVAAATVASRLPRQRETA